MWGLKSHSTDRETEAQALPLSPRPPVCRADGWVPSYCPPRVVVLSLSLSLPGPPACRCCFCFRRRSSDRWGPRGARPPCDPAQAYREVCTSASEQLGCQWQTPSLTGCSSGRDVYGLTDVDIPEQTAVRQGWIKSHKDEIRIVSFFISVWASSLGKISPDGSKDGTGHLSPTSFLLYRASCRQTFSSHCPICHWMMWITCPSLNQPCGWGMEVSKLPALSMGRKGIGERNGGAEVRVRESGGRQGWIKGLRTDARAVDPTV